MLHLTTKPILCVVAVAFAALSLPAQALDVGVAVADITPDVEAYDVPLAGYGAREGKPATGVHDRIKAKILYLRDGETQMAMVTLDLRSVTPQLKNQILEKTSTTGLTKDNLLVCASHTHAAPSFYTQTFWQWQFGEHDPAIVDKWTTSIALALREAIDTAAPAKIGFGSKKVEGFTANRRWGYDTDAREAAGEEPVTNPVLWVMRVDNLDGEPTALFVNFGTHPTIMGADNMQISAEWPGVLQRELEERFPGAVALFSNGTEGDQRPDGYRGEGFERIEDFGTRLAGQAALIATAIETKADVPIGYRRVTPELPPLQFTERAQKQYPQMEGPAKEALPRKAELQLLRIGDRALVGLPGEPIVEVGMDTAARLRGVGFEETVIIGLANDYVGYILNAKEYAHGGYEVDSRSYYGPELGDFIARQAHRAAALWKTESELGKSLSKSSKVLFDGNSFDGWLRFVPDPDVDPSSVWSIHEGVIHCTGQPSGYLRTVDEYANYRLTFEWRWPGSGGNNGLLVHIKPPDTVWPKSIEAQLMEGNAGDLWVIGGADFKEHVDKDNRRVVKRGTSSERPLGQWNRLTAECNGDTIRIHVNGVLQNVATEVTIQKGFIGLQSEGTPVQFRDIVLEPL